MKRVIFAASLLFALICFNSFCLFSVANIKEKTTGKLDDIYAALLTEDSSKTALECENFKEFWLSEHHVLCIIVRHDLIDQITLSVSSFVPLAKFENFGDLASEISECKILIEEIWDSEIPYIRNIL